MFLTPDAEPFWGGTYFPLEPRFGRPGFKDVLTLIEQTYRNDREKVDKNRTALVEALQGLARSKPGDAVTEEHTENMARSLLREVDGRHGGIGGAPKFPQCSMLELLWRSYLRTGSQLMKTAVVLSMERMCQGGIYDHLGGGFARYSTDERWLAPHFEKMLYDNAQLLDLLCHVWQETREPLFAAARRRPWPGCCARCARARARSRARSTPIPRVRRASSTSGTRPRSTNSSARTLLTSRLSTTSPQAATGRGRRFSTGSCRPASTRRRTRRVSPRCARSCWNAAQAASAPAGTTRCWRTGMA